MEKQIKEMLHHIENAHNFTILYAVESGSRAWGFSSKDSDWDIRFIYLPKIDHYLRILPQKDNFQLITCEDLDFAGWDLRKTLNLLLKSNPPLLEWLQSPMVYQKDERFFMELKTLANRAFRAKSCLYHYFHMAYGNYKDYLRRDTVITKKYLYVLRPILACKWIVAYNTMPPMEMEKCLEGITIDGIVAKEILLLIDRKKSGGELGLQAPNKVLHTYILQQLDYLEKHLNVTPNDDKTMDINTLDAFFLNMLQVPH